MQQDYQYHPNDPSPRPNNAQKTEQSVIVKALVSELTFEQEELGVSKSEEMSSKTYKKPIFMVDEMENCYIDMKKSFEYVGDNSTFQKRITTILVIQWVVFSYMVNSMAYLFRSPTFLCRMPLSEIYYTCDRKLACYFLEFDMAKVVFKNTEYLNFNQVSITQEFNLICENENLAAFAQAMFFLGGFLSGYLFSYVSAKIGRRSILLIIMVMSLSSILVCAFAPSFEIFVVGYFMIGFCLFGYETSVYLNGYSAIRFRTISINMLTMVWAGTPIFLPFLTMIPTWRYAFMLFAGLLALTFPFAYKCFQESPRYLLSKGCYKQAREIFRVISITNQRPPYNFKLLEEIEYQNETYLRAGGGYEASNPLANGEEQVQRSRGYNYLDLFKFKSLKKITLVLMYWWMFRFFMYFGLNLALESILHSGLFLTMVIACAAIVEVIGSFGITLMTTILYRKYKLDIMKTALIVVSLCCLLMWFLEIQSACKGGNNIENYKLCYQLIIMIVLVILIKFFNTIFFSGLIGYYSQVFPTPVRSLGCGFTLTFGRLGTIIVPFYINYMKVGYPKKNSLCFMTPFGIFAFLLCFIMPYTEQEGMKQNIEEQLEDNRVEMKQI